MGEEKTVALKISSPLCEEEIEVPADLWERFEQRARELEATPEELFPWVMDHFLKRKDAAKLIAKQLEGGTDANSESASKEG